MGSNFSFPEHTKIVPVMAPVDASGSALTTEWINVKNATKATWLLHLGVLNTSASAMAITLNVANDASGTKSATSASSMDVTLPYYHITGATAGSSADTLTKTSVSSSTWTIAQDSDDGKLIVVEVEAQKLGTFSSSSTTYDADYVRLAMPDPTASALVSCVCILTGLRYKEDSPPTAIT